MKHDETVGGYLRRVLFFPSLAPEGTGAKQSEVVRHSVEPRSDFQRASFYAVSISVL
jgi:hypothetical protein